MTARLLDVLPYVTGAFTVVRLGTWIRSAVRERIRRLPPLSTDLRAVYPILMTADERRMIRAQRPRLRDIAGWDPETLRRIQVAVRREPGHPSFLDAVEDVLPAERT